MLLCSLLLPCSRVTCQPTGKELSFTALTINDGLSQGMVTCIFQDRYGFMWFATLDGLNRYDGYHFVVYRHDAQDAASISEGLVQTLFEDSQGRLWIGTLSGKLDLFDRKTETFIHVKYGDDNSDSLSKLTVHSVSEDKHGNIWVQTSNELYKITFHKNTKPSDDSFSVHHVAVPFHSEASFLSIIHKSHIYYVNAKEGIIYKLDDEKTERWSVALNINDYCKSRSVHIEPASGYRIGHILEDTAGGKFYVFYEDGILCCNQSTGALEKAFHTDLFTNGNTPLRTSLDKDGVAWFACRNNLYFFDTHSGQFHSAITGDPDISRCVTHSYTFFTDRSGLLWVGTGGYGILKRNALSEAFHHTGTLYTYSIKEAGDGNIILGNSASAHQLFDKETGKFLEETAGKKTKTDLPYRADIITEKSGDWFIESNKLYCYDKNTKQSVSYSLPVTSNDGYDGLVQCGIMDLGNHIWLGTTEGLLRFSLVSRQWTVYKSGLHNPSSLSSNLVFSLCLDPAQPQTYLWVGTGGSGLNRMDMTTGNCMSYSIKNGLPNNVIYGILNDDEGNLWMSTNKGLTCFNPPKQTFRNFDYKDGLQSNEFNRSAYLRTKDGCLFFGGVNGFNYFYPRDIFKNTTVPQIEITGLSIHNQPVPILPKGSPLTQAIYLTKTLTLPYAQNFVSFEFASMDFTNSEQNQYQYKLDGFDKDWIHSGNTHSATYTNLDPGTYTFTVKGSNNHGVWNERGTSIQVIILPPWYMTWWFRTALAVALMLTGYSLYRYRLAQVLKLQAIRDRIAGDLHDEVGSNLSNIYIFSNIAQQKETANAATAPLLQKITEYTQQSMEAMNDIVWMINTRNDRFENIMVRMRTIAAEFADTSGCSLHLDFDENLNDVKLNMEERKNFYLIYKEVINNAAKYAECKILWIEMNLDRNVVTLRIEDNGKGFDIANTDKGNGMFTMKKRAETLKGTLTISSTVGEGTAVQLRFTI